MYRQLLGLAFKGIKAATDYLLPYSCISCTNLTQEQDGFCHRCWAKINFIGASLCNICGRAFDINIEELISTCGSCLIKKPQYDSARSLMHYDDCDVRHLRFAYQSLHLFSGHTRPIG